MFGSYASGDGVGYALGGGFNPSTNNGTAETGVASV